MNREGLKVVNVARALAMTFTNLVMRADADHKAAVHAFESVRDQLLTNLSNDPLTPTEAQKSLNAVKQLIGNELRKFSLLATLTADQRCKRHAYRRAFSRVQAMIKRIKSH